MKNKITFSAFLIVALIATACASATPTTNPASLATPMATEMAIATDTMVPPAMPMSPAMVNVGQNLALGSFLVDSAGMTLYIYTRDTPGTSICYSTCATNWPPLLTNGAPTAGTGVTASMLGTTTRTDGMVQVTYNGWPLYYFITDKTAGDTNGEGVQSVWYVMTPAGTQK